MKMQIQPSRLTGSISIPASKSHSLRAILFASLAEGKSTIHRYLLSPDAEAMMIACRMLGATIDVFPDRIEIIGVAGKVQTPDNVIDAGNSGQVVRFVAAIAALNAGYTVLTGDDSIRHNRPVQPLLNALNQLGAFAVATRGNGFAPIVIKGPLKAGYAELDGADSQPVSGLLMALAFVPGASEIVVHNAGEKPWVNLTLSWFDRLGITYQHQNFERYQVSGGARYPGFSYVVSGDFSSAAFPIVAALITQSQICLDNIDMQDVQGDKAVIAVLQQMGAHIIYDDEKRQLLVKKSSRLVGRTIDVNDFIDAVPILAVVACVAEGETHITGAKIARMKESDRLLAITTELKKMGADIELLADGLIIRPALLQGAIVSSHHDHRIAMSLAVAGLIAKGKTIVDNTCCVAKSFPGFVEAMQNLGASLSNMA